MSDEYLDSYLDDGTPDEQHLAGLVKHYKALADLVVTEEWEQAGDGTGRKVRKPGALLEALEIAMGKMCGGCTRVVDSNGNHPCAVCEHIEWNKIIADAKAKGGLT